MNDDLIRRSDAIEMLQEAIRAYPPVMKGCGETRDSTLEEAINLILDIPSADRPQGKWIATRSQCGWKCSLCGTEYRMLKKGNFCTHCGARMKGVDDE